MTTGDILAAFISSIGIGLFSLGIGLFSLEEAIASEQHQLFLEQFVKRKRGFNRLLLLLYKEDYIGMFAIFTIPANSFQRGQEKRLSMIALKRVKLLLYIYMTFTLLIFKNFHRYESAPERILLILAALVYLYFLINLFLFLRKLETFTANQPQEPPEE